MAVTRNILGMNARNFLYIRRYNPAFAKRLADDKLATKKLLLENNLSTPQLLATFETREDIRNFDWTTLPTTGFAIKPARGYGGLGILVMKRWEKTTGRTIIDEVKEKKSLESYILDIQEGAYSLQFLPDVAFIEERIIRHSFFKKLAAIGIPDIRVIVFNRIPIMAMLRLPTAESHGKANIHQGAIAFGIDMRSGVTTSAIFKNKRITRIPGTKIKIQGIKIPEWEKILLLATKAQSISGLGYAGIDIVLDENRGPLVLEINARPGLAIQKANRASLRTRLERVEHMDLPTPARGVEVSKSLFAESFSEKVDTKPNILTVIQPITIRFKGGTKDVLAKIDTGAYRTSVDKILAKELSLVPQDEKVFVKSASGDGSRDTVDFSYILAGKKITTIASLADRSHMRYRVIIGRLDLKGFLITPELHPTQS